MKNIKLYYSDYCPHCTGILEYVKENNLDVELVDTSRNLKLQKELLDIGGKTQVPMLSIDGKAMYESKDILEWIKENI